MITLMLALLLAHKPVSVPPDTSTKRVLSILACDKPRFDDTIALMKMLAADVDDMDIHRQTGANLARVREENRLMAKIPKERGDCSR